MTAETALELLRHFILQNPNLAGLTVFSIAFLESLAVVGLILPGVLFMFATGALIGIGILPFWQTILWAASGAFCGDLVSFWLGRRLEAQVFQGRWFRNHRSAIEKGIYFFRRYGWLSLLLGRFVGPLRPFLPLIAGIFGMPWPAFSTVALFASLLWAPAYLLPGMVVGTTLEGAATTTGYLLLVMALLLALATLLLWLIWRLLNAIRSGRRWAWTVALLLMPLSLLAWNSWKSVPRPSPLLWQAERGGIDRAFHKLGFERIPWLPQRLQKGLYLDVEAKRIVWVRRSGPFIEVWLRSLDPIHRSQEEVERSFREELRRLGWCLQGRQIVHCR